MGFGTAMANPQSVRWHGLDALRAVIAILVVFAHSCLTFASLDFGELWPLKDPRTHTIVFDVVMDYLQGFGMPAFFIISGFFSAMVFFEKGAKAMIQGRIRRILLPFIAAWILLYPIITFGFHFARAVFAGEPDAFGGSVWFLTHGGYWSELQTYHLWFLYLLLGISAVFWFATQALATQAAPGPRIDALFARVMAHPLGIIVLALPTMATMAWMHRPHIDVTLSFLPNPAVALCYLWFFAVGWMLYRRRDCVAFLARRHHVLLLVSTVLFLMRTYFYVTEARFKPLDDPNLLVGGIPSGALMTWCTALGVIGLAHARFNRLMPRVRYVGDASMWIYLVHHPMTIFLPLLLAGSDLSPILKAFFVFGCALTLSLGSYELFVRRSLIGVFLNGPRRVAKTLPATS
jgi:peptidoglycan/LPS O-acetylase OafA/YrhL